MHATEALGQDRFAIRLNQRLGALSGWRRLGAAAAFGGLATLALPPAGLFWVLLIAFPGLLGLLDGARRGRAAFAIGWFFGLGHHLLGLYWVSFALFTDIERFWWAVPFAVAGLPMLLALFTGLAAWGAWAVSREGGLARGLARPLAFAVVWALVEWLRGHILTGFPWNLLGYAWVDVGPVLQSVSLFGIYGLSLLTVAVACLPAALGDAQVPAPRALAGLGLGLALFAGIAIWGQARLAGDTQPPVPGVRLRLVQAAIPQAMKWKDGERLANFRRQIDLSALPPQPLASGDSPPLTATIWPETAIPFLIGDDVARLQAVGAVTPPGGLTLTGAPRASREADGSLRYANSLMAIDTSGAIIAIYDKAHLVPFGEYMPGRRFLPIGAIAGNGAEFSPGPGPSTLHLPGLPPVGPLICYEVIFPGAVVDAADRPAWLLNLTNDAWYGRTAGPHQHFAIAGVRAVEEGMPLVRVANNGISGIVDSYGRTTARLGLDERGILDTALPSALPRPTLYARFGDLGFVVVLLAVTAMAFATRQTR